MKDNGPVHRLLKKATGAGIFVLLTCLWWAVAIALFIAVAKGLRWLGIVG